MEDDASNEGNARDHGYGSNSDSNTDSDSNNNEKFYEDTSSDLSRRRRRSSPILNKLNLVLERIEDFPLRQRDKMVELAKVFLDNVRNDIHEMLCEEEGRQDEDESDDDDDTIDYGGLDSNFDSEDEVETAIRHFPEVLSQRKGDVSWEGDVDNDDEDVDSEDLPCYPINFVCSNIKAVDFTVLLVRLGIELNQFKEEKRGGLLCNNEYGRNPLQHICHYSLSLSKSEETNELFQNLFLEQLMRLQQIDLLKKQDVRNYKLVYDMFLTYDNYFAESRFRYLVNFNPSSLLETDFYGWLPLHYVSHSHVGAFERLQLILDYCVRYYPYKKGICLMFQKEDYNATPFQLACKAHKYEEVMDVIEETIIRYSDTTPLNVTDAMLTAAIDVRIHLDCVYFLLRRQPDVIIGLLSGSVKDSSDTDSNSFHNIQDDDGNNSNRNSNIRKDSSKNEDDVNDVVDDDDDDDSRNRTGRQSDNEDHVSNENKNSDIDDDDGDCNCDDFIIINNNDIINLARDESSKDYAIKENRWKRKRE